MNTHSEKDCRERLLMHKVFTCQHFLLETLTCSHCLVASMLSALTTCPAMLNTLSDDTDVAGTQR